MARHAGKSVKNTCCVSAHNVRLSNRNGDIESLLRLVKLHKISLASLRHSQQYYYTTPDARHVWPLRIMSDITGDI